MQFTFCSSVTHILRCGIPNKARDLAAGHIQGLLIMLPRLVAKLLVSFTFAGIATST